MHVNVEHTINSIEKAVISGRISEKQINQSVARIWEMKKEAGLLTLPSQGTFSDLARFGKISNKAIRMFFDDVERFLTRTSTQGKMKNALRLDELGEWNELVLTKYKIETVIFNKRKLAVSYSMEDDILNRLLPDSPVASDRPPVSPFLDAIRKKVGVVMVVSDDDYEQRVRELISTARVMNKK